MRVHKLKLTKTELFVKQTMGITGWKLLLDSVMLNNSVSYIGKSVIGSNIHMY